MSYFNRIERNVYILVFLALAALIMLIYGGYYLVLPSDRGEAILAKHDIPYPAVIAHRGASYNAPESTLPAFEKAMDSGADYLEADIRRTRDGKLVVFHDPSLQRTSNVESVYPRRKGEHISSFTYEELSRLDVGSWFNDAHPLRADDAYTGERILSLDRLLEIASRDGAPYGIVLDVKAPADYPAAGRRAAPSALQEGADAGLAEAIVQLLEKHHRLPRQSHNEADVLIFSFYADILERFRRLAPDIPRLLLVDDAMISRRGWSRWLDIAEEHADGLGVKGVVSWPWYIAKAHDRELFVFPYVVNRLPAMRLLAHIKSSGYITDHPELLRPFVDSLALP